MKPGETVLVHAGSGGVGQAAIHVALSMNCRVFTTVSSKAKREFLKTRFPALTDECFTNSREAREFEYHIMKYSNGRGVNIVINSLAQDKLYASLRCLTINGRFLEIGKFDVFNDTKIGMSMLSKGISIVGVLADLMTYRGCKAELDEICHYIQAGMKSGAIRPLSYHVFKNSQLEDAFRFMAQGKHIGKVLIQVKENANGPTVIPANPRTYFDPKKSYLIVGGLGGMGFELTNWMVERGARNLTLSSRTGKTSTYHDYHIRKWKSLGVNVLMDNSDVSIHNGAKALLKKVRTLGPIGGIFNVAVVLKDGLFIHQSSADFQDVIKCKADTTLHLDDLSRTLAPELDYFVVFSSIVAARGNAGQTSYGFANSVMERLCEERWAQKLPALAIQWGAVGDVGVFHRTMKDKKVYGLAPQSLKSCLQTLDLYLQGDKPVVSSFISYYKKQIDTTDSSKTLVSMAANILGIKDIKRINPKTPLVELGLDSLMSAELQQLIQSRNIQLSQKEFSSLSFHKLQELDTQESGKDLAFNTDKTEVTFNKKLTFKPLPDVPILGMNSMKTTNGTLFVVHPIDGTVDMLKDLVSQLCLTVYGIECANEAPLESLEKLAGYYLNKIREVQPLGPYKFCGYSFGANVAFEMALQLERRGETVSLLLMLDGSPRWKHYNDNYSSYTGGVVEVVDLVFVAYLSQYLPTFSSLMYQELKGRNTEEDKIHHVAVTLNDAYPHVGLKTITESVCALKARLTCGLNYNPKAKVKARTVLLRTLHVKTGQSISSDYSLGEVCENSVEVVEIPGNHYCFYEKFQELGIAEILNKIIS